MAEIKASASISRADIYGGRVLSIILTNNQPHRRTHKAIEIIDYYL